MIAETDRRVDSKPQILLELQVPSRGPAPYNEKHKHMKKTFLAFLAAPALILAADTFTGTVTDSMCGADHKAMNVKPDKKCVTECVKMGSKYALYDGKNTYTLSDQKSAAGFAAQKVTVTGTLKGDTIQVASIAAAK